MENEMVRMNLKLSDVTDALHFMESDSIHVPFAVKKIVKSVLYQAMLDLEAELKRREAE